MRILLLFLALAACTVPPPAPPIEDRPPERGVAEAPEVPPKPPPPKPKAKVSVEAPPPPLPPCPDPSDDPKKRILQKLDCLIKLEERKP